jgi:hypothetical protein
MARTRKWTPSGSRTVTPMAARTVWSVGVRQVGKEVATSVENHREEDEIAGDGTDSAGERMTPTANHAAAESTWISNRKVFADARPTAELKSPPELAACTAGDSSSYAKALQRAAITSFSLVLKCYFPAGRSAPIQGFQRSPAPECRSPNYRFIIGGIMNSPKTLHMPRFAVRICGTEIRQARVAKTTQKRIAPS